MSHENSPNVMPAIENLDRAVSLLADRIANLENALESKPKTHTASSVNVDECMAYVRKKDAQYREFAAMARNFGDQSRTFKLQNAEELVNLIPALDKNIPTIVEVGYRIQVCLCPNDTATEFYIGCPMSQHVRTATTWQEAVNIFCHELFLVSGELLRGRL